MPARNRRFSAGSLKVCGALLAQPSAVKRVGAWSVQRHGHTLGTPREGPCKPKSLLRPPSPCTALRIGGSKRHLYDWSNGIERNRAPYHRYRVFSGSCAMPVVQQIRTVPGGCRHHPGFWSTGIAQILTLLVPMVGWTVSCDTGGPAISVAIAAADKWPCGTFGLI